VDSAPPSIGITSAQASPTTSTGASFSFVAQDSQSGVAYTECQIDGGVVERCVSPKSYSGLSVGSHVFRVRAADNAGNISNFVSQSWSIVSSVTTSVTTTTAPVVTTTTVPFSGPFNSIPSNAWVNVTPTYEGGPVAGGILFPFSFNQMGIYDPISRRTIVYDRWYDPVRSVYIYANALIAYDPPSNKVSVIKVSNWRADGTELPENATDPTPIDRHPLGGLGLDPVSNTVYFVNGANQMRHDLYPDHPNDTWKFNLGGTSWRKVADFATDVHPPTDVSNYSGMVYDPVVKKFAYFVVNPSYGTHTWLLDPATDKWAKLPQDPSAQSVFISNSGITYDSKRNRAVAFAGGYGSGSTGSSLWSYSLSLNQWTRLANAPVDADGPEFAYDSRHDIFLAVAGNKTLVYHPLTNSWSSHPAFLERGRQLNRQNITYNPAYDVFVFQGGPVDAPVWSLFRFSE
jgi:hypothetical protein